MITIVLAAVFVLQAGSSPIGMILQTQGDVVVQRGNSKAPAKLADLLYPGDQVVSTTGQATFVFCPTSERASITGGARVELSGNAMVTRAGAAPSKAPTRCSLPKVALGAENLERVGGLRPRGDPPISLFVGGPVSTTQPVFQWGAIAGATSYQVTVSDPATKATILQQRVTTTSLAYPQTMVPLKSGSYQWEVRAEGGGKTLGTQSAMFEVKPNAELAKSAAVDPSSILANAVEFENAGYYAEAAAAYRTLQQSHSDDTRFARRLASLYWSAGLIAATNEMIEKTRGK